MNASAINKRALNERRRALACVLVVVAMLGIGGLVKTVDPTSAAWTNDANVTATASAGAWSTEPSGNWCAVAVGTCVMTFQSTTAYMTGPTTYTVQLQGTVNFAGSQRYQMHVDLDTILKNMTINGRPTDLTAYGYPTAVSMQANGVTLAVYGCGTRNIVLVKSVPQNASDSANGTATNGSSGGGCVSGPPPALS